MMKKLSNLLPFIVLVISSFMVSAQETDYTKYHDYINQAEHLYFIEQRYDEAFEIFDNVFDSFDFIFLKDCVNLAQLAYVQGRPYKKYIFKGFENGLKCSDLKGSPTLDKLSKIICSDTTYLNVYKIARKKYLRRIDFELLGNMMDFYIEDQIAKVPGKKYEEFKLNNLKKIKSIIYKKGYPGEKLIGVNRDSCFSEIGFPNLDFGSRVTSKYAKHNLKYLLSSREIGLSSTLMFIPVYHIKYAYLDLKDQFKNEVKKGNIHPREVGVIYDHMYALKVFSKEHEDRIPNMRLDGFFFINPFQNMEIIPVHNLPDRETANRLRASWQVTSVEHDLIKSEYSAKHGLRLFWGWDCL